MTDDRLISLLKQANIFLDQYEREALRGFEITPAQSHMLNYLLKFPEQTYSATDIRLDTGVSKAAISSSLKGLKQKGYITIRQVPEDERKKEILLTPKALDIRRRMDEHMRRRRECLCRGISREELETMEDGLEKIVDNMKQEYIRRNSYDTNTDGTD